MRAPNRTTRLAIEHLDDRIVPARIDLTQHGAEALAAGALLRQTDAMPAADLHSIVRLDGGSTQQGYNTNARPLQFDERPNRAVTRAVTLGQVPAVVVNGATYREFVLDIRESRQSPRLSLDEVRVFLGDVDNLRGYNNRQDTLAGRTAVFDLDAAGDNTVILDERTSRGQGLGDMTLLVPESAFAGATANTFVYLYSRFGGVANARADGGVEQWSVRLNVAPPPPPTVSSLSGHVFYEDFSGQLQPLAGVPIELIDEVTGDAVTVTTDANGAYSFTGLAAGTYIIVEGNVPNGLRHFEDGDESLGTINGVPTGEAGDDEFTVTLGAGQNGVNYDFHETEVE